MAVTFGQSAGANAAGASFVSVAYPGACTNGSLLIAAVCWPSSLTVTVSDPTNGTWSALGAAQLGTGGLAGFNLQLYAKANTGTTALTVTATFSGAAAGYDLAIAEYLGAGAYALESYSTNTTNSATPTTPSLTPASSTDFAFAYDFCATSVTSVSAPYTARFTPAVLGGGQGADNLALTGGVASACTFNCAAGDNSTALAIFKLPPAGGLLTRTFTKVGV